MSSRASIRLVAGTLVAVALLGACSGGDATETTTTRPETTTTVDTSDQPVVFGRGSMPDTVPEDFPLPDQAVIGSTLIDRTRGVTEVVVTFPTGVTAVSDFYATNLEALGYTVNSSSGSDAEWVITFSKDALTGEARIMPGGNGLSSGTIVLTVPVSG
jgi:hypothetical protein